MLSFPLGDWTIAYERQGSGSPILFFHNGGTSHAIWLEVMARLAPRHTVVAVDLLGYGASSKPGTGYTMTNYVELVGALYTELELERATLVGNCMGSAIALSFARLHPERVSSLVLINPLTEATFSAGWLGAALKLRQASPKVIGGVYKRLGALTLPAWTARTTLAFQLGSLGRDLAVHNNSSLRACHSSQGQLRSMLEVLADIDSYAALDRFVPPAGFPERMTIWGAENRILSARAGEELNQSLRPTRHERLNRCGHLLMLERPAEVAGLIQRFVESQPTPGTSATEGAPT
jgi:pimeloyl-ACP methyl ester carboxylesterase